MFDKKALKQSYVKVEEDNLVNEVQEVPTSVQLATEKGQIIQGEDEGSNLE